jgi:hypothetical protein
MTDFGVQTPNYQPVDWSWLGNLPDQFYQGAKQKQQYDLSHAFQKGVPLNPDGTPNAAALLQIFAKDGDVQDIPQLGAMVQQQQQLKQAQTLDPMLGSIGPGGAPSGSVPVGSVPLASGGMPEMAPPASAAGTMSTARPNGAAPLAQPAQPSGAQGGPSVDALVASALPRGSDKAQTVAANIARAVGVQAGAPLSQDQLAKAQKYISGYLQRNGLGELPGAGLLARGLRNDNPGNIEDGSFARAQPGYTGPEPKGRFATFDTPEDGLNAASTLIGRYAKAGINTVSGIVSKWAPSSDGNNVAHYSDFVARSLGVDPTQPLDLSNPRMRQAVATAMSEYENGQTRGSGAGPQGQSQAQSIIPQVPLPKGFTDPQQAILAMDAEMARLSTNPAAKGQIAALQDWRDRIAASTQPMMFHPGETAFDPRTGKPIYQAPGGNANNIALQRFLAENPDATPEQIQAFTQSGRSGRSAISMYMNRYLQENPDATADDVKRAAQLYTTQTTAQNRFLSGPQGNTIRSLNVVVSHLQTMQDLGDALKNGNIVAFNRVAQTLAEQTGSSVPTNFDTAKQIVGAEVIKALGVAGAGTQSERQEAADAFNSARSPAQLNQAIAVARRLLIGELQGLRRQYVAATGLGGDSFDEMLEPQTRSFFGEGQGGGESSAPASKGNQNVPRVASDADYDALSSGTIFIDPEGKKRRKP